MGVVRLTQQLFCTHRSISALTEANGKLQLDLASARADAHTAGECAAELDAAKRDIITLRAERDKLKMELTKALLVATSEFESFGHLATSSRTHGATQSHGASPPPTGGHGNATVRSQRVTEVPTALGPQHARAIAEAIADVVSEMRASAHAALMVSSPATRRRIAPQWPIASSSVVPSRLDARQANASTFAFSPA